MGKGADPSVRAVAVLSGNVEAWQVMGKVGQGKGEREGVCVGGGGGGGRGRGDYLRAGGM